MNGTSIWHCLDCRESWEGSSCFVESSCQHCQSINIEEYSDTHWKIDEEGRVVKKEPIIWAKYGE